MKTTGTSQISFFTICLILIFSSSIIPTHLALADVPSVNDISTEINVSPIDSSQIIFSVRHNGATLSHYIAQIELEIDGNVIELTPLPPDDQITNSVIEYNFTIQATQFNTLRVRARCIIHGWSSWTQLNNRLYKLYVEPVEGFGSTDPVPASYVYNQVVTVPVIATPATGWSFSHWELDGEVVGDENPFTVTMSRSHRIKAVFTGSSPPPQVNYTLTVEPVEGSGTTDPAAGSYVYHSTVNVPITATPETGVEFDHWELDGEGVSKNPYTVTMDKDHTIKAVFIESQQISIYTLTVESPSGTGLTDPDIGSYIHYQGDHVLVTATPDPGWGFDHWEFDSVDVGADNPLTITIDGNHSIKAVFIQEETDSGTGIPSFPVISLIIGIYLYYLYIRKNKYSLDLSCGC
jgi:desulfoferrodoxin (superoxide reductase-like protein)